MTEEDLIQKLQKIERLFSGATTHGERDAAASAMSRIREKLEALEKEETAVEYKFKLLDSSSQKLFIALLRRYGIEPYRKKRQRRTTIMARVPKSFVDETLWPEFQELSKALQTYISDITDKVIREHINNDASEATVSEEGFALKG